MFEITYNDKEKLEKYIATRVAYLGGIYDFTFENTYIVYHWQNKDTSEYIAIDMRNGLSSNIIRVKNNRLYDENSYCKLMPYLLYSVKYNGERRYYNRITTNPTDVIDSIFRVVLANEGYSVREEQIALCKKMFNGFTKKKISICEAEVGTGKTLAYLVAGFVAKLYQMHNNGLPQPVTISTSSIELQRSIITKEIPMLSAALLKYHLIETPLTAVLRKGKEHYFCLLRYQNHLEQLKKHKDKYASFINVLEGMRKLPFGIDLDNYRISHNLKKKICVKDDCKTCSIKDKCPYIAQMQKISKEKHLDFQVTNHNLYVMSKKTSDEDKSELLIPSGLVVIDEAHKFKSVVEDTYTDRINQDSISTYIKAVRYKCTKDATQYKNCIEKLLQEISVLFEDFALLRLGKDLDEEKGSVISLSYKQISSVTNIVSLLTLINQNHQDKACKRIGKTLIKSFENILKRSKYIVWLDGENAVNLTLCVAPKNINVVIKDKIWNSNSRFILTSGTMSDGNDFEYFKRENGLDRISKPLLQETKTESGFNYANNARLYIPEDMPYPNNDDAEYLNTIADRCYELICATNGHTAILFTSYKVLNEVYLLLKERLTKYEVICMTRGNKTAISDFKKAENGVLFASGPMWEGVSCNGDVLSSLIIVRLPFPIRSGLLEQKKNDSADKFIKEFCLPNMLIKLRQGAGRLIRTETDTGVISILDVRASKNGKYHINVYNALKKYPLLNSVRDVEYFMRGIKDEGYFEGKY